MKVLDDHNDKRLQKSLGKRNFARNTYWWSLLQMSHLVARGEQLMLKGNIGAKKYFTY